LYGHPKFFELLKEMRELYSVKDRAYSGEVPLSNFMESEKLGIPAWKGVLVRMGDKWRRIVNLAGKEDVGDEKLRDTLLDLAVYSLICIILLEEVRTCPGS